MRLLNFIFIFFIAFRISAQELKTITINDEFTNTREEISVLASDNKVKHGKYKLYRYDHLRVVGNYVNNHKVGNWIEYYGSKGKNIEKDLNYKNDTLHGKYTEYFSSGKVKISGNYLNGLKNGVWETYDPSNNLFEKGTYSYNNEIGIWEFYDSGKLTQKYNYDTKEFIVSQDNSYQSNVVIYDDLKNPLDTIDIMPYYIGGIKRLYRFLGSEIEYPRMARDNGIEGTVFVQLMIDENGKITSTKVLQGIGAGCDEESVRALLLTSGKWVPAYDEGKPIQMKFTQPISFTLGE